MRLQRRAVVLLAAGMLFGFAAAGEKYALLVGINAYPQCNPLNGCVNDVALMEKLLTRRFGFPSANMRRLLDTQATAAAIVEAFRAHLIAGTKPGDLVVFHFSGHGTQVPDDNGDEDDGRDEAIVPYDVQASSGGLINLIRDDLLGELADQLGDRQFVVVLDSCFSGTGIRSLGNARYVSFSELQQKDDPVQLLRQERPVVTRSLPLVVSGCRDVIDRAQATQTVLLAACRSDEKAKDLLVDMPEGQRHHGVFTANLWRILENTSGSGHTLTYGELGEYLANCTDITRLDQHPQIEGDTKALTQPVLQTASGPGETPGENTPPSPPAAVETAEAVRPLAVYVAPHSAFFGKPSEDDEAQAAVAGAIRQQPFVRIAESRDAAEVSVYHGKDPDGGGNTVVGVLLPGGETSLRQELAVLDAASLAPIVGELRRIYLVNNLLRLRSADSGAGVSVTLAGAMDNLGNGDRIVYEITARREGYLTLINVDCQGGIDVLLPNAYAPARKIAAGATVVFPPPDADYEVVVEPPLGDEYLKVFLTDTPLDVPDVPEPGTRGGAGNAAFLDGLARAVRVRPKSTLAFDQLGQQPFSEASLLYRTYAVTNP